MHNAIVVSNVNFFIFKKLKELLNKYPNRKNKAKQFFNLTKRRLGDFPFSFQFLSRTAAVFA
jgi:hypothetical protein